MGIQNCKSVICCIENKTQMIAHMLFTLNKRESEKNNNREKQKRREKKLLQC